MTSKPSTLYQTADEEIRRCIDAYLELASVSKGFSEIRPEHLANERSKTIVMAGYGFMASNISAEDICLEWQRRQAQSFDLETAISASVYSNIRVLGEELFDELCKQTEGFSNFDPEYLRSNPQFLPIFQRLCGVPSKAHLKRLVGSVSDTRISKPAAIRIVDLLSQRLNPNNIVKSEILTRLESTLEGIVRDLIGRVLLESIVETALRKQNLAFLRENEYHSLPGVIYDFRADFVLPDAKSPRVFVEVRKSSSRHASLYAKDKMFSAINWKGKSEELLAVLVVDGEWTNETLRVMASVFDYVVPIGRIDDLAQNIKAYINGDTKKLKWLIDFRISPANQNRPTTFASSQ